jgi:enoyl-CoA hydratase/carnithine racemase
VDELSAADSDEAFVESLLEYAQTFTSPKCASLAVGMIKRAVKSGMEVPLESGLALERELQQRLFASEDAQEGMRSFSEKRKPEFQGR